MSETVHRARRRLERGQVELAANLLAILESDLAHMPALEVCPRFVARAVAILELAGSRRRRP